MVTQRAGLDQKCVFLRISLGAVWNAWLVGKDQRIYRPDYPLATGHFSNTRPNL
jgi:hypothetical protein